MPAEGLYKSPRVSAIIIAVADPIPTLNANKGFILPNISFLIVVFPIQFTSNNSTSF